MLRSKCKGLILHSARVIMLFLGAMYLTWIIARSTMLSTLQTYLICLYCFLVLAVLRWCACKIYFKVIPKPKKYCTLLWIIALFMVSALNPIFVPRTYNTIARFQATPGIRQEAREAWVCSAYTDGQETTLSTLKLADNKGWIYKSEYDDYVCPDAEQENYLELVLPASEKIDITFAAGTWNGIIHLTYEDYQTELDLSQGGEQGIVLSLDGARLPFGSVKTVMIFMGASITYMYILACALGTIKKCSKKRVEKKVISDTSSSTVTFSHHRFSVWNVMVIFVSVSLLLAIALVTAYIDPFFHYHGPLDEYQYKFAGERYMNDGIVRHFNYDAIITGTSMTQNFKTSTLDMLFGTQSIKTSFSGATNKELADNLDRAFSANSGIKMIVRSLDTYSLVQDKDLYASDFDFPTYLTNNNPFDDVKYLLNKNVFFDNVLYTFDFSKYGTTTTFDTYSNWNSSFEYGKEAVLSTYDVENTSKMWDEVAVNDEQKKIMTDNLDQNILRIAREHPDTKFYIFFPPYSICYWDTLAHNGTMKYELDLMYEATKLLLEYDNIYLYGFSSCFETVCDLNNYKDTTHYGEWINDEILQWMYKDEYRITKDNLIEYFDSIAEFYSTFPYDNYLRSV